VVLPHQLAGTGRFSTTEFQKPQNRWEILIDESIKIRMEKYVSLQDTVPEFARTDRRKSRKISVRITDAQETFEPNKSHTKLQGLQENKYTQILY
jgi:hypothetical protein